MLSQLLLLTSLLLAMQLAAAAQPSQSPNNNNNNNNDNNNNNNNKSCLCQTSSCLCCIELNLTSSIDLGGAACVNVQHRQRNVSLNLNYGDNPTHNATIALDGAAHKPTCMNLLSDLAQICAKFESMSRVQAAVDEPTYNGCLVLQPALLGTPQATYPVGCFSFDHGQVRQIQSYSPPASESSQAPQNPAEPEEEDEEEDDDDQSINAEELLAVVSASAEQGIALFSQWLGLNLAPRVNLTSLVKPAPLNATRRDRQLQQPSVAGRRGRTISILGDHDQDSRNDEKFKQLLSAQDNVLRESATIGDSSAAGMGTVFFYPQLDAPQANSRPEAIAISPENLAIVSSESRRGGRAYNIHQHVNEV
ncbi:phosphatidylinositol 4-kinase-like [Trichogramma pretiosum]|uniref:phosphatidylinositol 4-kinase-like n=1 Tax=Trichogramma pretiosum TaxID=7493 RepID=UPI000C718EE9|nr:phosphatidylinositol 4-kinase-like [Trichogramma pretiosum]